MGRPFANDHLDFFLSTRFFSIFNFIFSTFIIFLQKTSSPPSKHFFFFFKIFWSRYNLADLFRTICSCLNISFTGFYILSNRLPDRWLGSLLEGREVRWRGGVYLFAGVSHFCISICTCVCIFGHRWGVDVFICLSVSLFLWQSILRWCVIVHLPYWHFFPPSCCLPRVLPSLLSSTYLHFM